MKKLYPAVIIRHMEKIFINVLIPGLIFSCAVSSSAQVYKALDGFAIEVSLDNTELKRLPVNQNSISSLIVIGDYIIGGTSAAIGLHPYVFTASLSERNVIDTKELDLPGTQQEWIRSGFCRAGDRVLFAGTMPSNDKPSNYEEDGGHLIEIRVDDKGILSIRDLGIPIHGEGIYALLPNLTGTLICGISYPTGLFFTYDTISGQTHVYKDIMPSPKEINDLKLYILSPPDYLCRALIQDNGGMVYGSLPVNKIFYFNPENKSFHVLQDSLPVVWGRMMLGSIDSWAKSDDGKLYGGNAGDGQLFVIDPVANKLKNLGKPVMMNRLRGLCFGRNGKLYGVAGDPPGYTHFFSYDDEHGFQDFGNPQFNMVAPGIDQGIGWRGYNIGTLAISEDGKYIIMGEDETLSQLLIFIVPED